MTGGPGYSNVMEYVTMATLGNGQDFGDMTYPTGASRQTGTGVCNSVIGCFGGGPNSYQSIDYITIASKGNASYFGEMTVASTRNGAASSPIRGVFMGGSPGINTMDYITFATHGDAIDFGDINGTLYETAGLSNGHGGL